MSTTRMTFAAWRKQHEECGFQGWGPPYVPYRRHIVCTCGSRWVVDESQVVGGVVSDTVEGEVTKAGA